MQKLLPTTAAYDTSFLFVNITVCFHIPFGSHVVWGPKTKQTTSNILDHISLTLKIFTSCRSKLRQQNFRSKSLSKILPSLSSQNYIRIRLGHCWLQANSWASWKMTWKSSWSKLKLSGLNVWQLRQETAKFPIWIKQTSAVPKEMSKQSSLMTTPTNSQLPTPLHGHQH